MTEVTNQDNANINATNQGADTSKEQQDIKDKSFTQADIDKAISERLKREKDASEKRIAETLRKEREEWERQSKLSEEQRAEEQRKQMESELSEKERNLALRENRADARELLIERGIDSTLVDFVVDVDADKTKDNVNQLEKAYAQAVKAGVDKALAGTTPKDTSMTKPQTDEKLSTKDLLFGKKKL